jgi:beta-xylosidase
MTSAPRADPEFPFGHGQSYGPGQTARVRFELHADLVSYAGRDGCRQVEPDEVELRVGAPSADIRAAVCLTLSGPRRNVGFDSVLQPTNTLLPPD